MLVYIPRSFIHTIYIYTIGLYLRNLNCNKPIIIKNIFFENHKTYIK